MPFHSVHGVLKARLLKRLAIPFPVDHVLSELSTMKHASRVAVQSMAHSLIELQKAMVHFGLFPVIVLFVLEAMGCSSCFFLRGDDRG